MAEIKLSEPNKFVNQTISNTRSNLIEITEDKLENVLLKHEKEISKSISWITPLAIFLTILIVFLTASFKDFIGINKDTWQAVFIICFGLTFIWTIICCFNAVKYRNQASVKSLIDKIKDSTQ